LLAAVATLSLLAATCAGTGDGGSRGRIDYATGPSGTSGTPAAGATAATGSPGSTGGAEADVEASVNNYLFDPDPLEVSSGDVLAVRNGNTRTPHTFTVVGEDVDLTLGPLETKTVEITLEPGTYDLICRFHETLGMTGTLIVT